MTECCSNADTHTEKHFNNGETVRDIIIGISDGLTVPFALAAGMAGGNFDPKVIVVAGLAEVVAGVIAMGFGAYLAGKSEEEHYASECKREWLEISDKPDTELSEVAEIFEEYGLCKSEIDPILQAFKAHPKHWHAFMMRFELGLEKPCPGRASKGALTIGASYAVGGLIPLAPYFLASSGPVALLWSSAVTALALFSFGFGKGCATGTGKLRSAIQMTVVGGLAAAAAFVLAHGISH